MSKKTKLQIIMMIVSGGLAALVTSTDTTAASVYWLAFILIVIWSNK